MSIFLTVDLIPNQLKEICLVLKLSLNKVIKKGGHKL